MSAAQEALVEEQIYAEEFVQLVWNIKDDELFVREEISLSKSGSVFGVFHQI